MRRNTAAFALALLAFPMTAHALDLTVKQEAGVSIPLTEPQSDEYGVGFSDQIKVLFGVTPYLSVGPSGGFMYLPAKDDGVEGGVAWTVGGGARVRRPIDEESYYGISPWADADLLYVRTGDLSRPGFDAAIGFSVPLDEARRYSVGPFVRYQHIFQTPDRAGYDNRDAKTLTLGLSFEIGAGIKQTPTPTPTPTPAQTPTPAPTPAPTPVATVAAADNCCTDTDSDGLPDTVDRCPLVAGPGENWGCPVYKRLVIKKDKLELKERLYFAWNAATLQDVSFPVLDEVVQALKDNKNFKVQVEGHTSSEGSVERNQTLSEQRAAAVLDYLVAHGIAQDRLVSKGFGGTVPVDTNKTSEGRENNRRVEFLVNFILLNDGKK